MADFATTVSAICRARLDMTFREVGILLHVGKARTEAERSTKSVLAALQLPSASASRAGKSLERQGYLTRQMYRRDERSTVYALTARGQKLVDRINAGYGGEDVG